MERPNEQLEEHKISQTLKEKDQSYTSNGFFLRHVDMNLANRVYKTFPQEPVDSETLQKIIENFENERGAYVVSSRPYLSQSYIPYVDGFLDYQVKNDWGTGLSDEAYKQRRKAFLYCSKILV